MAYRIIADYHTHTQFSHGKGNIEDNVLAAIRLGLKRIAITDHGRGHLGFGIRRTDLPIMKEKIIQLRERYPEIEILLGVEANLLDSDGTLDIDDRDLEHLDILLAGYHFGSVPTALLKGLLYHGGNYFNSWGVGQDKIIQWNTEAACNAMDRYPIRILTHPGAKGPLDMAAVAKKAAEKDVWLEINAHHGYLTVDQIRIARQFACRFVINSDAHHPDDVGNFASGIQRAEAAGLIAQNIVNAVDLE